MISCVAGQCVDTVDLASRRASGVYNIASIISQAFLGDLSQHHQLIQVNVENECVKPRDL